MNRFFVSIHAFPKSRNFRTHLTLIELLVVDRISAILGDVLGDETLVEDVT